MLPDEQIKTIIKSVVVSTLPQWKQTYYQRLCTNLQVHTKGLLFSKVDVLFPNEHPDSKRHCVNTYEPITKGSIWKAINDISRIFSNSSFSFSASDVTAETINGNNFGNNNLFNWFLSKWIDETVATDANSWVAVYPEEYIQKRGGDQIRFVHSERLTMVSEDMVAFVSECESTTTQSIDDQIMTRELFYDEAENTLNGRSIVVKTYNHRVKTTIVKPVYHVFTKGYLLRIWIEDQSSGEYSYELYPFKNVDLQIPCFEAGGVEIQSDIQESFVAPFIPFGNLALLQHRNHRAVDLMFSYPRMSEIQTPCDGDCKPSGISGIYMVGGKECSRCKGSGFITVQSPYKVYQKRFEGGLQTDEQAKQLLAADPVSFHTPDVSILNYSKDSWKDYLRMAEEAVFVVTKKQSADAESAQSKRIDQEDKYAWLLNVSKVYFETLRRVIQSIENYVVASPVDVSVEAPTSFAILSEGEAFDSLNVLLASNAPVPIKAQQVDNFLQKFVSKSSPIVKAWRILKKVDPLLLYSTLDLQTFKSNFTIRPETWTTHIYAYPVLMQLYEEDKQLFDREDKAIIDMVKASIEELAPQPAPDLKTMLLKSVA